MNAAAETLVLAGYGVAGIQLAWRVLGARVRSLADGAVLLSLAFGLAAGLCSAGLFVGFLAFGPSSPARLAVEGLALVVLVALLIWLPGRRGGGEVEDAADTPEVREGSRAHGVLRLACWASVLASGVIFVSLSLENAHGTWDAWGIWNLRARAMSLCGDGWRKAFDEHIGMPHADYPILIPSLVVRVWRCVGFESVLVPMAISFCFMWAVVGLAVGTAARFRGGSQGCVVLLALLGVPLFQHAGASQCSDVPLSFYPLACGCALLLSAERSSTWGLVVAGMTAACAAWTKNEGVFFLPAIALASAALGLRRVGVRVAARKASWFALGAAPFIVTVVLFKTQTAWRNDLADPDRIQDILAKISDPSRYVVVAKGMAMMIADHGGGMFVALAVLWLLLRFLARGARSEALAPRVKDRARIYGGGLLMALCFYSLPYLITQRELHWHFTSSLDRLLLQLYPGAVMVLAVTSGDPWGSSGRGRAR